VRGTCPRLSSPPTGGTSSRGPAGAEPPHRRHDYPMAGCANLIARQHSRHTGVALPTFAPMLASTQPIYLLTSSAPKGADVSVPVVEGDVLGDDSEVIGGVLLFVCDGSLHNLEVYSFTDEPLRLPSVTRAGLRRYREGG
jgi:hypothetical protein